ncbi:hypothetical protein [Streptomyces sp. NPDC058672]|uniref:hypothetical protein n=1 Tax=unclassified Streptomyces TaxID=2593676 RepID=UPI003648EC87
MDMHRLSGGDQFGRLLKAVRDRTVAASSRNYRFSADDWPQDLGSAEPQPCSPREAAFTP